MTQRNEWNVNVNNRQLPRSASLDAERVDTECLEESLMRSAAKNAGAVVVDAYQAAVVNPANIALGLGQVSLGALGLLKDLGDAAYHRVAAAGLADKLDAERAKLTRQGRLPHQDEHRAEHLRIAAANLRALRKEDWPLVKEGLERIAKGVAFTVYDLASMPVDAAQAMLSLSVALGIKAERAIERTLVKVGRALERVARQSIAWAREGLEDGLAWAGKHFVGAANRVANGGPRFYLRPLPDHPATP